MFKKIKNYLYRSLKDKQRKLQLKEIIKGERKMLDKLEKNQMKAIIITLLGLVVPKIKGRDLHEDQLNILRNICIDAGIIV